MAKSTGRGSINPDFLNWSKREPKLAGKKVWEMVQRAEKELGWRRRNKSKGLGFSRSKEQHARAIIDTVCQKLFGLEEPKTQLVGTDCEWEVRRQGIWADRFVEGTYHLSQASYPNLLQRWGFALAKSLTALRTKTC